MVYLIGWELVDYLYIFFFAVIITICFFIRILKKRILQTLADNKIYYFYMGMHLMVLVIIGIIIVFGVCQKIYGIAMYKNNKYETVEGTVENVDTIYANNSHIIRGVKFSINDIDFTINKGILNAGYSCDNEFEIMEDDFLKVYYIRPLIGEDVSFILRIDRIIKD